MNLYEYLTECRGLDSSHAAGEAKRAYARFQKHGRTCVPQKDCDPFTFMAWDGGFQSFTFDVDQVVKTRQGELAIVTGWGETPSGWKVRAKTANGEYDWCAGDLTPAAFPEGLVEILRGRVHTKVDEAFA